MNKVAEIEDEKTQKKYHITYASEICYLWSKARAREFELCNLLDKVPYATDPSGSTESKSTADLFMWAPQGGKLKATLFRNSRFKTVAK